MHRLVLLPLQPPHTWRRSRFNQVSNDKYKSQCIQNHKNKHADKSSYQPASRRRRSCEKRRNTYHRKNNRKCNKFVHLRFHISLSRCNIYIYYKFLKCSYSKILRPQFCPPCVACNTKIQSYIRIKP